MNKKTLKYILSIAVAGILLYFSFREVKWDDFVAGLHECRWELIAVSMAAGIVAFLLRALRWRDLLLPIDASLKTGTVFNAVNIGYIANFVFPRIGEFVRCGVITDNSAAEPSGADGRVRKKASYDKVLGTVVLERGWDMLTMILLMVAILFFGWEKFGAFFMEKMWGPMSGRIPFSLWWVVAVCCVLIAAAIWLLWKFRERNAFPGKIWSVGRGVLQGIGSCLKMDRKWLFFFYTMLIWTMYLIMSYCTMKAIPAIESLGLADALFLMIAGSFGWLIPVPGGFGAFHFVVSLALSTIYGIPFETGIIFATLSHESQAITMAVCGGISYVAEMLKK